MIYEVTIDGRARSVEVKGDKGGWLIAVDGAPPRRFEGGPVGSAEWILREDGRGRSIGMVVQGDDAWLQIDGHPLQAKLRDPRRSSAKGDGAQAAGEIVSPMPGAIVRVNVTAGQPVHKGQVLVVVEAMKMENEFKAPFDGVVESVHVQAGQTVESGAKLVVVSAA